MPKAKPNRLSPTNKLLKQNRTFIIIITKTKQTKIHNIDNKHLPNKDDKIKLYK